jgi:hypothetical protein
MDPAPPPPTGGAPSIPLAYTGTYSTRTLDAGVAALSDRGVPAWQAEQVYAPFIVGGPTTWSNSWGAPRHGPGSLIRSHQGQDVLCELGDPVLAAAVGEVHFDIGLLGGLSATIHLPEGGALYYAHLSGWNPDINEGQLVVPGQVLGYCGRTGNATVPHVHFGLIRPDGSAVDPMPFLVAMLRAAEFELRSLHGGRPGGQAPPQPVATERPRAADVFLAALREDASGTRYAVASEPPPSGPGRADGRLVLIAAATVAMGVAGGIWWSRPRSHRLTRASRDETSIS